MMSGSYSTLHGNKSSAITHKGIIFLCTAALLVKVEKQWRSATFVTRAVGAFVLGLII